VVSPLDSPYRSSGCSFLVLLPRPTTYQPSLSCLCTFQRSTAISSFPPRARKKTSSVSATHAQLLNLKSCGITTYLLSSVPSWNPLSSLEEIFTFFVTCCL
ncbi:hypothetical protein ILYODFUR_000866, partial [Ilyodon furcidens]